MPKDAPLDTSFLPKDKKYKVYIPVKDWEGLREADLQGATHMDHAGMFSFWTSRVNLTQALLQSRLTGQVLKKLSTRDSLHSYSLLRRIPDHKFLNKFLPASQHTAGDTKQHYSSTTMSDALLKAEADAFFEEANRDRCRLLSAQEIKLYWPSVCPIRS